MKCEQSTTPLLWETRVRRPGLLFIVSNTHLLQWLFLKRNCALLEPVYSPADCSAAGDAGVPPPHPAPPITCPYYIPVLRCVGHYMSTSEPVRRFSRRTFLKLCWVKWNVPHLNLRLLHSVTVRRNVHRLRSYF